MGKLFKIKQIVYWGISILLAWVFGKYILWNILGHLFGYDVTNYGPKKGLLGVILLTIISLSLSTIRDRQNGRKTKVILDNIIAETETKYLELTVFASRIALSGYICVYWLKQGQHWQNNAEEINVDPHLFIVLLALGAGVALITLISSYLIVLEPWRIFIVRNDESVGDQYKMILSIGRGLSFLLINLLFSLYFVPRLEPKLPSVLAFVACLIIITKIQIPYFKDN